MYLISSSTPGNPKMSLLCSRTSAGATLEETDNLSWKSAALHPFGILKCCSPVADLGSVPDTFSCVIVFSIRLHLQETTTNRTQTLTRSTMMCEKLLSQRAREARGREEPIFCVLCIWDMSWKEGPPVVFRTPSASARMKGFAVRLLTAAHWSFVHAGLFF